MFDALNANAGSDVAQRTLCRHCNTNKAHVNAQGFAVYRGLCNPCYNDRDIRDLYPPRRVNRKAPMACGSCGGYIPDSFCPICVIANDQERETLPLFDDLPPLNFENLGVR